MFLNMLEDLPSKWFKLEETRGETLDWNQVGYNFISDFQFQPTNKSMKEVVKEIKEFITEQKDTSRPELTCNTVSKISKKVCQPLNRLTLDNDKIVGKCFRLSKNHPVAAQPVRTLFTIAKADENQGVEVKEEDIPKLFTELKEGERYLEEKSPSEWLDAEIKYKEVDCNDPKIY